MGVGGMFSSVVGACITQYYHPKYTFLIYSFYGLVVMVLGFYMDTYYEVENEEKGKDVKESVKKADEKSETFTETFKLSVN